MLNGFIPFWGFVRQFLKAEINFWHQISSLSRKLPIKCRFQNRCREYVRDPHPNQKKTRQPMPACRTSKVWLLPEVSKKNGQNFQGFKVSYASTSPSFLPSRLAFWSFCSFRNVWPLRVAVSSCSNRKEKWPNCADGFSYQFDDFEMKTPPFLESENPVSKIFGGFLKTYRKTIHVEMLTSWYTWNLKHLFINGCFTKHPLKTGCLGYQATISNLNFLNLCCSHRSRAWPSPLFGRRGPLLITFFGGGRCCLKSKTGSVRCFHSGQSWGRFQLTILSCTSSCRLLKYKWFGKKNTGNQTNFTPQNSKSQQKSKEFPQEMLPLSATQNSR